MQPVAIQRSAEVIGSGHEQLPQHFGFPRSQRLRIHGMDVRICQQAQPLQPLVCMYRGGKSGNRSRIENVAPLYGGGHIQMVLDQKVNLSFFLRRKL